jgi:septum formation protein
VLASGSPQRRAILERLGVPFEVRVPGVEEVDDGEEAAALTLANAARKARAAARAGARELVLACDTLVALNGRVYGKPPDRAAAESMLRALGGRTHEVVSGLVLLEGEEQRSVQARTQVSFRVLDERLLGWYLAREEWRGRAGAYAIQGAGAALVREVRGDYENVVGLPLASLLDLCPELLAGELREAAQS